MDIRRISTIALPMSDYPDIQSKFNHALELMEVAVNDAAELICLPEVLNRFKGNTPATAKDITSADYAIEENSSLIKPFLELAKKNSTAVALPLLLQEDGKYINSCLFIDEEGTLSGRYDKVYLPQGEVEAGISPGRETVVIDWRGLKVGFMICFDMSFPSMAQKYQELGAKLILFPTQFGGGKILNSYAALFSMYIISAYSDYSRIVDPLGRDSEAVGSRLEYYRWNILPPVLTRPINFDFTVVHMGDAEKFPAIKKKYGPKIEIEIDQGTSIAMINSLSVDVTVNDIMSEFEMASYADFLADSRKKSEAALL